MWQRWMSLKLPDRWFLAMLTITGCQESMAKKTRGKTKLSPTNFIVSVGKLLQDISKLGYQPTLVGGMALVTLGSRRVTKDFDFLIGEEARDQKKLVQTFYKHGF